MNGQPADWYALAIQQAEASRRLLAEAQSMLRWFRSTGGPIDVDRSGYGNLPALRTRIRQIESNADPAAIFEAWLTGADLQQRVRMVRRYRALARAVRSAQRAHHAVWWSNPPRQDGAS